jgi:hypothetical protein
MTRRAQNLVTLKQTKIAKSKKSNTQQKEIRNAKNVPYFFILKFYPFNAATDPVRVASLYKCRANGEAAEPIEQAERLKRTNDMNKSEKMMAERMNFVNHRGRSAESRRRMWLQRIRAERNNFPSDWICVDFVIPNANVSFTVHSPNWRRMKLNAKKVSFYENYSPVKVYDHNTQILIATIATAYC